MTYFFSLIFCILFFLLIFKLLYNLGRKEKKKNWLKKNNMYLNKTKRVCGSKSGKIVKRI